MSTMLFRNLCAIFILLSVKISSTRCLTSSRIPELLIPCYNGQFSMENKPPSTITILIELVRKLELNKKTYIDLKILLTTLLHRIILDGILKSEKTSTYGGSLLYRARGSEFNKYKLVTDYIVTRESTISLNETLTQNEICFLHNMLSTVIDKAYRGDERTTCRYNISNFPIETEMSNLKLSSCPIMKGNIFTNWGTVTPGQLVYGLSAVLTDSRPSFDAILRQVNKTGNKLGSEEVNSIWISTIAGDLAEALLNRADNDLELAVSGFWNDTSLPMDYFLSSSTSDLTESKLLGAIDSLILAYNVISWEKFLMTTKLSQILDMYYSKRGIAYQNFIKASNRKTIFSNILKKTNLTHQVIGAAMLLKEIADYDRYLSNTEIKELVTLAVDKFEEKLDDITTNFDSVEFINGTEMKSYLEVILVMDGSFDYPTSRKIIYTLAESMEVSIHGSKLGVINGQTGEWMSNISGNIFDIFEGIETFKSAWPKELNLQESFRMILDHYQMKMKNGCRGGPYKPLGTAIVILSNKAVPQTSDLNNFKKTLSLLKNYFPETNILYALTSNSKNYFQDLPHRYLNDSFIDISDDIDMISTSISGMLRKIPGEIINIYCDNENSKMEDYLTPGIKRFYEIHEEYNKKFTFDVKFTGSTYGNISICYTTFSPNFRIICENITENHGLHVKTFDLCSEEPRCNLHFVLNANSSVYNCAENDCRYPDQVRLDISWLKSNSILNRSESLIILFCYTVSFLLFCNYI